MEKSLTEKEMVEFNAESANELLVKWGFDPTREIRVIQNKDRRTMRFVQEDEETT